MRTALAATLVVVCGGSIVMGQTTRKVGDGYPYSRIQDAITDSADYDIVEVYPRVNNAPYELWTGQIDTNGVVRVPGSSEGKRIVFGLKKGIKLVGKGSGGARIVIDGNQGDRFNWETQSWSAKVEQFGIRVENQEITIDNFEIRNCWWGSKFTATISKS